MSMNQNTNIDSQVASFLAKTQKLLIDNQWVESTTSKTFAVENPATGDVLSQASHGDKQDIDKAVKAARHAFDHGEWTKITAAERARIIYKLADLLEAHTEEFAQLESLDNGKPLTVARAADVALSVDMFRYMAGWATKIHGETFPISVPYTPKTRYLSYTMKEPVGVVGQIIPWNFPLLMAVWKLAPALACGCTIVLKPAEQTPLSALRLGELIVEAGFPKGVV
ncbi:MAG: aldehyde dehydrogenase family protein, partial [bacterium]|nr:aldehyde dehydrogenase family protein [bacterium]